MLAGTLSVLKVLQNNEFALKFSGSTGLRHGWNVEVPSDFRADCEGFGLLVFSVWVLLLAADTFAFFAVD